MSDEARTSELKVCSKCSQSKPVSEFYFTRGKPIAACKVCRSGHYKAKREANPQLHRERSKAQYWADPKAHNEKARARYRADPTVQLACTRAWLKAHPEHVKAQKVKNINRNKDFVRCIKESTPCVDCGQQLPPWVTHFDHLEGTQKKFNVSKRASSNITLNTLQAEIAKCELVCAVCHAHRTYCRQHNIPHYVLHTTPQGA